MRKIKHLGLFLILFTIISRILGFVREIIIAYFYGTSLEVDVYILSQVIGELVGNVVMATTLSTLVLLVLKDKPFLTKTISKFSFLVSIILTILILIFIPLISQALIQGNDEISIIALQQNIMILAPSIIFITIATVYNSFLNYEGKYLQSIISIIVMNCTFIFILVSLFIIGGEMNFQLPLSYLISTVAYFAYAKISYNRLRETIKTEMINKEFKNTSTRFNYLIITFLPIFISTLINKFVLITDRFFTSIGENGQISAYNYALKIINLPIAVLGTALINMMFVNFLKSENSLYEENRYRKILFYFGMIIAIFIFFNSQSIVQSIYGYGKFTYDDVLLTSEFLKFMAILVPIQFILLIYQKISYEYINSRKLIEINLIVFVLSVVFNFILIYALDINGVNSVIIVSFFSSLIQIIYLKRVWLNINIKVIVKAILFVSLLLILLLLLNCIFSESILTLIVKGGVYLVIVLLLDKIFKINYVRELIKIK